MDQQIYKKVEIVGSSPKSMEDAVRNAVERASQSLRNLRWFEVKEIRGRIDGGEVGEWQVGMNVAFSLDGKVSGDAGDLAGAVTGNEGLTSQSEPVK